MSAREKHDALCYLRRSTSKQELGIHGQLEWAIKKAGELGVHLDATLGDLDYMLKLGSRQYKAIFLDDGVSGFRLDRPGFLAFREFARQRASVSHVFVHKTDRFARPEMAIKAMEMEMELLLAGITVVFQNRISEPRERGEYYLGQDFLLLHEYSQSGEFLVQLAERVLQAQIKLAKNGYWCGGPAPYGFCRVLVDALGNEIMKLPEGTTMRREGCHVRIKPDDGDKIKIWLQILDWFAVEGWGLKRIANELNTRGIPSPHAGKTRKSGGVQKEASGKWCKKTVSRLIDNQAIIGMCIYGGSSRGTHRRFSLEGPRNLTQSDRGENGDAKQIQNKSDDCIIAPTGYDGAVDAKLFQTCRTQREDRGRNQRGITRSDPGVYPLSTRLYDLTPGCGAVLYGVKEKKRRLYMCSRNTESKGKACYRNSVDAEASLRFVLDVLRQRIHLAGGRKALRSRLEALAHAEQTSGPNSSTNELDVVDRRRATLEQELKTIGRNLARASDKTIFEMIQDEYRSKQAELAKCDHRLEQLRAEKAQPTRTVEQEIEMAMSLFDELERIATDKSARSEINSMLSRIHFTMGLRFAANPRGRRPKRVLIGGAIHIGQDGNEIPCKHHSGGHPPDADGAGNDFVLTPFGTNTPTATSDRRQDEQSLGKVSLGERSEPPTVALGARFARPQPPR